MPPVLEHRHGPGGLCSIIGGHVVSDPALRGLRDSYIYGDYCDSRLRVVRLAGGRARDDRPLGPRVEGTSSFGEDAGGRLYVMSVGGRVYRIAPGR